MLWEDRFDDAAHLEEQADVRSTVVYGDAVFVAGHTTDAAGKTGRLVRAYDYRSGRLHWEDRHTASDRRDSVLAIAAELEGVFTAGSTTDRNGMPGALVRAYDRQTGRVLWEDVHPPTSGNSSITVKFGRVFVAGGVTVGVSSSSRNVAVVWAYDAATGKLLWQDLDGEVGFRVSTPAITTDGLRVYTLRPDNVDGGLIRAYDVATGELLWQTVRSVPNELSSGAMTWMVAQQTRVFVAGAVYLDRDPFSADLLVGAYDTSTGRLLWEDRVDVGENDEANGIAASANGVFVTGSVGNGSDDFGPQNLDFFVRGYDAETGRVRWTDRIDSGIIDAGLVIAVKGDRAFAAGPLGPLNGIDDNRDFFIRAYDGR